MDQASGKPARRFARRKGMGAGRYAGVTAACLALALSASGGLLAEEVAALPPETVPLARAGTAEPTAAWRDFCSRHPSECEVDARERTFLTLTPETWALIVMVNRRVNERIRPISDIEHWGVEDRWDFPDDGAGDCEDFQILKRRLLAEAGLPRRAMRMTVVLDENGDGHAVLMLRTDRGDLVLDNKRTAILPWRESGYLFIKREGQDSRDWVSLEETRSPVATAASEE